MLASAMVERRRARGTNSAKFCWERVVRRRGSVEVWMPEGVVVLDVLVGGGEGEGEEEAGEDGTQSPIATRCFSRWTTTRAERKM